MVGNSRDVIPEIGRYGSPHSLELDAEQDLQQHAQPEHRHRDQHGRTEGHEHIPERVALDRRYDSRRNAEDHLDDDGRHGQLYGVRQFVQKDLADRPTLLIGIAQVALEQIAQVVEVLHDQRVVQPVSLDYLLVEFGGNGLLTRDHPDGVSRQDAWGAQDEEDDGDPDEHRDHLEDATGDIANHPEASTSSVSQREVAGRLPAPCHLHTGSRFQHTTRSTCYSAASIETAARST